MTVIISVLFFLAGVTITILSFRKELIASKRRSGFKKALIILIVSFVVWGVWDILNRSIDSKNDKNEILDTTKNQGKATRLKVDTVGKLVKTTAETTGKKIDKDFTELGKKTSLKPVYSAIIAFGAVPKNSNNPILSKTTKEDSLDIEFLFTNYGKGTAFNISMKAACVVKHNGTLKLQGNRNVKAGNKSLLWPPNPNATYSVYSGILANKSDDSIFYCLKIDFSDSTKHRKSYPQILLLNREKIALQSTSDEDYNAVEDYLIKTGFWTSPFRQ